MDAELELTIGPAAHGGHCVARHEGKVVFVRHAIPGERVKARITSKNSRYSRADAVQVIEASPDRVPSVWPQAGPGGVGGGELGHLALAAQRIWKRDVIKDVLGRIGRLDTESDPIAGLSVQGLAGEPAHGLGYRTRVELVADGAGRAGMHGFRSNEVLAVSDLPLAHERIAELGLTSRQWQPGARIRAIAPSDGEPLVLVDDAPLKGKRRRVRERVEMPDGSVLAYRVDAAGFWQVHTCAPSALVNQVVRAADVSEGDVVYDLYSGAGLLTSPLAGAAGSGGRVIAVEGDEKAARDARRNAHTHDTIDLRHGDVRATLADLEEARADVVVLDPPRAGAGEQVMAEITAKKPRRIVYVACDPAALARDVSSAAAGGYRLTDLAAFDLFPHTHHMECVATLEPS